MMIIVFNKEEEKWEWFNEQVSSNVIMQWEHLNDDEDVEETLFYTAKTHQFILQEVYGQYKESNKKTPYEALAWLAVHDFRIPPDMLKKYFTEDNRI
jgi:hypothetical protein